MSYPAAVMAPASPNAPKLLEVVSLLGALTDDLESVRGIPAMLLTVLPVDQVALAIVHRAGDTEQIILSASAGEVHGAADATAVGWADTSHRPFVLTRVLTEAHRLVLTIHYGRRAPGLSSEFAATVENIADALEHSLGVLLAWRRKPAALGGAFAELTTREWNVLLALDSELSEKELAVQLGMSLHTVHSHIKQTYRKLGARGRLPALRLLRDSVRHYHAKAVAARGAANTDAFAHALLANDLVPAHPRVEGLLARSRELVRQSAELLTAQGAWAGAAG